MRGEGNELKHFLVEYVCISKKFLWLTYPSWLQDIFSSELDAGRTCKGETHLIKPIGGVTWLTMTGYMAKWFGHTTLIKIYSFKLEHELLVSTARVRLYSEEVVIIKKFDKKPSKVFFRAELGSAYESLYLILFTSYKPYPLKGNSSEAAFSSNIVVVFTFSEVSCPWAVETRSLCSGLKLQTLKVIALPELSLFETIKGAARSGSSRGRVILLLEFLDYSPSPSPSLSNWSGLKVVLWVFSRESLWWKSDPFSLPVWWHSRQMDDVVPPVSPGLEGFYTVAADNV